MKLFQRKTTAAKLPAPATAIPDGWQNVMNEIDVADKPDGVTLLEWTTDLYEREQNCKTRTVAKAIQAKIAAHEAAQKAKAARHNSNSMTASLRDYQKQTGDFTLAGYAKHKAAAAAKPAPAPVKVKATARPAPAPKPAPAAPQSILEQFNELSGPEASAFFTKHRIEILAQEAARSNAANIAKNQ